MPEGFFDIGYDFYMQNRSFVDHWCSNDDFIKYCINKNMWDHGIIIAVECYQLWLKKRPKPKTNCEDRFKFITIQDFQRRTEDIDKLLLFIKNISYLYSEGKWIIEQGKSINVHVHLLVKLINPKTHKKKLSIEWSKLFDTNIYDKDYYKLTQCNGGKGMVPYEQWVQEKLDYFNNDKKGSHSNIIDLGLSGEF